MKKLFLALVVLVVATDTSLKAPPYEDHQDHDWNDEYWHRHHYGYVHGERGYWRYRDGKHEFIRVGPNWRAFGAELRTAASLLTHNMWPRFGATRGAAKALGQFIPAC